MGSMIEELERALSRRPPVDQPALPGRMNHLRAGVLVPILAEGREVVLTRRTAHLKAHAGEVCFPGGKPEAGDDGLEGTALREAREELGIRDARVLGRLSSMPVYTSEHRLEPFVAAISGALVPEPGEVAQVLYAHPFDIIQRGTIEGVLVEVPAGRWEMPVFRLDGWLVFGATALTLVELIGVMAHVLGRPEPTLEIGELGWRTVMSRGAAALR